MKKKLLFMGGIAVIILAVITAIIICTNKTENEEGITRYEWIQMLTEQFGKTDYDSETPYYKDVPVDNEYYASVQIARQWKILDDSVKFNGEKNADGEFVVLTAMRAIGKHQIQLYLQIKEEPKDKDLLELALQEKIMEKGQLAKNVSKEEAENILSKIEELYLHKFWGDDYAEISYQDKVKELEQDAVLSVNGEGNRITVSDDVITTLKKGDIIVYSDPVTGEMLSKKISSIYDESVLELEEVQLDDVVDSLYLSDNVLLSADEVFSYLAAEQADAYEVSVSSQSHNKDATFHSDGVSISIEAAGDDIVIEFSNNDAGVSIEKTLPGVGRGQENISVEVSLSEIDTNVGIIYENGSLKYVNTQIDSDISLVGEMEVNVVEWSLPLGYIPIPIAGVLGKVEVEVFLVVNMDGTISLQVDVPTMFGVNYTQESGIRTFANAQVNSELKADCSLSVGVDLGPNLSILGIDVLSVGVHIGVSGKGEKILRTNSNIISCTDLSFALPIIYIQVEPNELLKEQLEVSWKWALFTEDNALVKDEIHYERYSDGTQKIVDECTYAENEVWTSPIEFKELDKRMLYYAKFTSDFVEQDDCYVATGKLYGTMYILREELKKLQLGDSYNFYGHEFIYEGDILIKDLFLVPYGDDYLEGFLELGGDFFDVYNEQKKIAEHTVALFTDCDNRKYYAFSPTYDSYFDVYNLGEYVTVENANIPYGGGNAIIDDNYVFRIWKDDIYRDDDAPERLEEIETISGGTVYSINLYTDGSMSDCFGILDGAVDIEEDNLPRITVEWEKTMEDDITDEEAIEKCLELMMNLSYDTPESTMAYFDKNGDYSIDSDELMALWYWTIDNYNYTNKSELSEEEKINIGKAVYYGEFRTPDNLFNPLEE